MLEKIKNKTILLDTNVIINSIKYKNYFKSFFDQLNEYNISPAVDEGIKYEFLRSSDSLKNFKIKNNALELLFGGDKSKILVLPSSKEIFEEGMKISILYSFLGIKSASAIDCLIAAQLKKYEHSLYLATINNKDFTTKIFDRTILCNIEALDEIFNIGIYKFSETKYSEVLERFEKSA